MNSTAPKPFAFVLMPFSREFDDVYKLGIKPAAESAGFYCERLDEQMYEERMLERIYNQIGKSDMIIADMSTNNPNVFYEVGYAHALDKRTILLARDSKEIPFDLAHHFHIIYDNSVSDLKESLAERLAYYRSHPSSEVIDPFKAIQLTVNGESVDLDASRKPISAQVYFDHDSEFDSENTGYAIVLDIGAHLSPESPIETVYCEVFLITADNLPHSLIKHGAGSYSEYLAIKQPHGRIVHKPLQSLSLTRGSWDSIPFHLRTAKWNEIPSGRYPMTLRLITEGLVKDVELEVTPSSPPTS